MHSPKICAIGDYDTVMIFRSLGIRVYPVTDVSEAGTIFNQSVKEGFHVIFLTEKLARDMGDVLKKVNLTWTPMVAVIPDCHGSTGYAFERVRETVKKAIGADIFKEPSSVTGESADE
jgi:V/A-type H+-transporting ATPase subunit F